MRENFKTVVKTVNMEVNLEMIDFFVKLLLLFVRGGTMCPCCKTLADCDLCDFRFPRNNSLRVHIEFYSGLETTIINHKYIVLHEQKLYVLPEWVL